MVWSVGRCRSIDRSICRPDEMTRKKERRCAAAALLLAAVGLLVVCSSAAGVPAVYVFGDSLVDVGNNGFLPPPAPRAAFPCGVDLGSAGRFTNGYNLADIVAQRMGFNMSPPAYLSLTPQTSLNLLRGRVGANYASGGSGILNITGNGTITLREQVQLFVNTKASMIDSGKLGNDMANRLLSRSLFLVSTGGNDFAAFSEGRVTIDEAPAYIASMVSTYIKHIKALYKLGARRLGILDVLPVGCVPSTRTWSNDGVCDVPANSLARGFNALLRAEMATAAAAAMPDLIYSIASIYNIFYDMINNPQLDGLEEVASACCGGGRFNAEEDCSVRSNLCADRDRYLFWDKVHGTQAAYKRAVAAMFDGVGAGRYTEPISFEQLVGNQALLMQGPVVNLERRSVQWVAGI